MTMSNEGKRLGYTWQKVFQAVETLVFEADAQAIQATFSDLMMVREEPTDAQALKNWRTVKAVVDSPDVHRAENLTSEQRREYLKALWSLHGYLEAQHYAR